MRCDRSESLIPADDGPSPFGPGRAALRLNLALFVGAALALNALIFGLGWGSSVSSPPEPVLLPGWLVGAVGSGLLFPLLATVRWLLGATSALRRVWVTALFVLCASWPLYGLALGSAAPVRSGVGRLPGSPS